MNFYLEGHRRIVAFDRCGFCRISQKCMIVQKQESRGDVPVDEDAINGCRQAVNSLVWYPKQVLCMQRLHHNLLTELRRIRNRWDGCENCLSKVMLDGIETGAR